MPAPPLHAPIDPAIIRRASEWIARIWADDASASDRQACLQWRAAHPDHERAWRFLQAMSGKLDDLPRDVARHALLEPEIARAERSVKAASRRRTLRMLGLIAVGGGALYAAHDTETWRMAAADFRSGTGEIRELLLPDGTRVVLNTASAIDLRFTERERLVVLRAGEILVSTARDPAPLHRPFSVQSRQGRVTALGTRFTVRQDGADSQVAVFEGAVEIRPQQADATAVRIDAGQGARFSAAEVSAADASEASASKAAWAGGNLIAESMRMDDFLAELSRYRHGLLRCEPAIAGLRVTGVFRLRDTDQALSNLSLALPVEVSYRTRYWVTVRARAN
ncbi:FecR domain-containing protein [Herbaspirillum lusitanum]|uniref:FecR domain-containing protein n=1 Tax=Herbaspirillum lusitanum TaxID=213312 RepID=A0ABW9AAI2_9BURK